MLEGHALVSAFYCGAYLNRVPRWLLKLAQCRFSKLLSSAVPQQGRFLQQPYYILQALDLLPRESGA